MQNLFLTLTGGSDVDVKGKVETARIDVSGGSQFKGKNLSIQQCNVIASGGSRAFVRAEKEISIVASGASKVRYHGDPQVLTKNASGVSKIKHKKI